MSDAELIEKTLCGNREAFSELVKRYRDFVFAQAYHRIQSFAEADDITQEVFLKAYCQLPQLNHPAQFTSWLRSIALRTCLNWVRHPRQLIPIGDNDTSEIHALMIQDAPPTPEEEFEEIQLRKKVWEALSSLPDPQQEALILYSFQERSYREIAAFLDVPISTIKGRIYSARKRLQKEMMTMMSEYLGAHESSEEEISYLLSFGPLARQAASLADVLRDKGYQLSTVTKREALLKAVSESPPEALLLDIEDEGDLALVQELVARLLIRPFSLLFIRAKTKLMRNLCILYRHGTEEQHYPSSRLRFRRISCSEL